MGNVAACSPPPKDDVHAKLDLIIAQFGRLEQVLTGLQEEKDASVAKVGVGIRNDVTSLLQSHGTMINGARNLETGKGQSLQSLAQDVCGFPKWKRRGVTLSDWARPCLSRTQLCYAAMDAVASLMVGLALNVSDIQQ